MEACAAVYIDSANRYTQTQALTATTARAAQTLQPDARETGANEQATPPEQIDFHRGRGAPQKGARSQDHADHQENEHEQQHPQAAPPPTYAALLR